MKERTKKTYNTAEEASKLQEPVALAYGQSQSFEELKNSFLGIINHYKSYFNSPQNKLSAIRKGLKSQALLDLMTLTGSTRLDIATLLDLTEPTLRKYINAGKALDTGLSEHILQLFELFDKGIDTFGSLEEFKNWLPQYNVGIDAAPQQLLDTITGIGIVMNELKRIDYGVLA